MLDVLMHIMSAYCSEGVAPAGSFIKLKLALLLSLCTPHSSSKVSIDETICSPPQR